MWLFLSFLVAVMTATQDILNKKALKGCDIYVVTWAWWFFSLPFLLGYSAVAGPVSIVPGFWNILFYSTIFVTAGVIFYIKALKEEDLSLSVPMLNFSPLFLLVLSPLMLKEYPSYWGMTGVALITAGSYILFAQADQKGMWLPLANLFKHRGARYMLLVAFLFSFSANFDKLGVLGSSPFHWVLYLNTAMVVILSLIVLTKRHKILFKQVKAAFGLLFLVGLLNGVSLVVQMYAIKMTQVPYLIAIKRTSVVLTALYGFMYLKEENIRQRLLGIVIMLAGVFIIFFS